MSAKVDKQLSFLKQEISMFVGLGGSQFNCANNYYWIKVQYTQMNFL